jgi:predicted lipoprotein with Yx(FWY)xxD motif
MRSRWLLFPSLVAAALVLAACGSNSPKDPAQTAANSHAGVHSVVIKTMHTSKGTILTLADGHALYWFAKDTKTQSKCNGSCVSYWPPVIGKATAAAGTSLPDGFGTIKRSDGQTQATYDGHPLYTYSGDTAAGQVSGNGLKLSGALWWAVTPTGKVLGSASSGSGGSGSGGSGSGGSGGGGW